jgi:hypothetical protein
MMLSPTVGVEPEKRARVLRVFAAGGNPLTMTFELNLTRDVVQAILDEVGNDRDRARAAAQQLRRELAAAAPFSDAPPAAVPAPAAAPEPVRPAPVEKPKPEPQAPVVLGNLDGLLIEADTAGGKFAVAADRIRVQVTELREGLAERKRVAEVQSKVERLQAELAAATSQLHALAPKQAKAVKAGPDPKVVREWAAQAGVDCGASGRVPQRVIDAYLASRAEVAS